MKYPKANSVRAELVEALSCFRAVWVKRQPFDKLRANGIGIFVLLSLSLSACGLKPLYSGGSQGAVSGLLSAVSVDAIEGKNGWLMRNALNDRLGAAGTGAPRYRLAIKLDDQIEGFGVRADDTITRERRTLRARYQLIDLATGQAVLDATAGSDAGIDVVSSEYATIAGENTALENLTQEVAEQIITRLSLFAQTGPQPNP